MHPQVQKYLKFALGVVIGIGVLMILAMIQIYRDKKVIEEQVQTSISKGIEARQPQITVQKYDSVTKIQLENIAVSRQIQHSIVDNLHDKQLQSVLDSVYNFPSGHTADH